MVHPLVEHRYKRFSYKHDFVQLKQYRVFDIKKNLLMPPKEILASSKRESLLSNVIMRLFSNINYFLNLELPY